MKNRSWIQLLGLLVVAGLARAEAPPGMADPGYGKLPSGGYRYRDPRWELESSRGQEAGILDQVAALDQELGGILEQLAELTAQADALEADRQRHNAELAQAESRLQGLRVVAQRRVRGIYKLHRQGLARVIFGAEDPNELRRRARYLMALVGGDLDQLQAFTQTAEARRAAMQQVQQDGERVAHIKIQLAERQEALKAQREERVNLLREIRSQRDSALRLMAEMGTARADLEQRMGSLPPLGAMPSTPGRASLGAPGGSVGLQTSPSLEGAADPLRGSLAIPGANGEPATFRDAFGKLQWPVRGRVVHRFGPYTDPITGRTVASQGIDIAADHGEPVAAVFRGVIQLTEYVPGFGHTVVVDHGSYLTVYAHLSGIRVNRGDPVAAGGVVGLVGNSGLTEGDGYMLTFQVRYNGTPQDPLLWLERR